MKTKLALLAALLCLVGAGVFSQQGGFITSAEAQTGEGVTNTLTPNSIERQRRPSSVRVRPLGYAAIDCVGLSDSRCQTAVTALPGLPTCTASANPTNVQLSSTGIAESTITAVCSGGTNAYSWTSTGTSASTLASGRASDIIYTAAGTYCYSVAGRNTLVNLAFGAASAQACVTVTAAAQACVAEADYQRSFFCPSPNASSMYVVDYAFSMITCSFRSTSSESFACGGTPPPPPPGCISPRVMVNGVCTDPVVTPPTCTAPFVLNAAQTACGCPSGTSYNDIFDRCDTVVTPPSCLSPSTVINGVCTAPTTTCDLPSTLVNGVCFTPPNPLPCPNGGARDERGQCPSITCNAPLVPSNGSCVLPCPSNSRSTQTCPSPTTGSFTETITYGALPLCTRSVSSNSATACVGVTCAPTYDSDGEPTMRRGGARCPADGWGGAAGCPNGLAWNTNTCSWFVSTTGACYQSDYGVPWTCIDTNVTAPQNLIDRLTRK